MLQEGKWGVNVGNKDRTDIVKVKTLLRAAGLPPNALDAAMSDRVRRHPFRTSAIKSVLRRRLPSLPNPRCDREKGRARKLISGAMVRWRARVASLPILGRFFDAQRVRSALWP